MAYLRRDDTVVNTLGNAIAGATVTYLLQPANVTALTPLANVYADTAGTPATNPQVTDGFGHAVAYLSDATPYTIVFTYPRGTQIVYTDQTVNEGGGGGTGGTPYAQIPAGTINGTNTAFTLTYTPIPFTQQITLNGLPLTPGLGYTLAGLVITLATPPQNGDSLYATYRY